LSLRRCRCADVAAPLSMRRCRFADVAAPLTPPAQEEGEVVVAGVLLCPLPNREHKKLV